MFSLAVFGTCEVDFKKYIFLTRSYQHIKDINGHFDGTLNKFGYMVLAANQEKKSHTFKYMLLQPEKSNLIISMIKDIEAHEDRSH